MLTRSLTVALSLSSAVVVVAAGCGRSSPVQPVNEQQAEQAAQAVCFDTKEELKAQLDTEYLAADTPTVSSDDVAAAVDAATSVDALRDKLDTVYQGLGGNGLSQQDVLDLCFDKGSEVLDAIQSDLDDRYDLRYLPTDFHDDFANLQNIPSGLLDGDNDTPPTASAPLQVNGARNISIDTSGCSQGEAFVFDSGALVCEPPPAAPINTIGVGSPTANTAPIEALPIVTKIEVSLNNIGAGATADTAALGAAARPKHRMLVIDAWAVQGAAVANTTFEVRQGATQITAPAAVGPNVNDVTHITSAGTAANRQVQTNNDLIVRVANNGAAAVNATMTVFILAIPF